MFIVRAISGWVAPAGYQPIPNGNNQQGNPTTGSARIDGLLPLSTDQEIPSSSVPTVDNVPGPQAPLDARVNEIALARCMKEGAADTVDNVPGSQAPLDARVNESALAPYMKEGAADTLSRVVKEFFYKRCTREDAIRELEKWEFPVDSLSKDESSVSLSCKGGKLVVLVFQCTEAYTECDLEYYTSATVRDIQESLCKNLSYASPYFQDPHGTERILEVIHWIVYYSAGLVDKSECLRQLSEIFAPINKTEEPFVTYLRTEPPFNGEPGGIRVKYHRTQKGNWGDYSFLVSKSMLSRAVQVTNAP